MKVSAVVLAAGAARRFGRPKQLERWPDQNSPTLVERVVHLAAQSGVSEVLVVTGNHAEEVAALFLDTAAYPVPVYTTFNPRWEEGQGFSVAAGVGALLHDVEAAFFFLADQPRIHLSTAQAILKAFEQSGPERETAIIFPSYGGERRNPALFGRRYFDELKALQGDDGGRVIAKAHREAVQIIEVDDPRILEDVDTPQDLANLG